MSPIIAFNLVCSKILQFGKEFTLPNNKNLKFSKLEAYSDNKIIT